MVLALIFFVDHFGSEMKFFFRWHPWSLGCFHPVKTSTNESLSEDVGDSQKFGDWISNKQKKVTPFWSKQNEWSVDPVILVPVVPKKNSSGFFLDACYAYGCHWQKLANSGQWPKIGRLRKGPFFWAEKKGRWVLRSLHEVGAVFVEGGKRLVVQKPVYAMQVIVAGDEGIKFQKYVQHDFSETSLHDK